MPSNTRTVCLEFFGNAKDAVPSIVEIKDFMFAEQKRSGVLLAGLEHLDDRYLKAVGYATKSKKLGFVAAKPIPQVLRNINAFTLGARSVDPTITTQVIFTGDWSMPVKEAEATNGLVNAGVDVITCHVDSPKVVVETAERRGIPFVLFPGTDGHEHQVKDIRSGDQTTVDPTSWTPPVEDLHPRVRFDEQEQQ